QAAQAGGSSTTLEGVWWYVYVVRGGGRRRIADGSGGGDGAAAGVPGRRRRGRRGRLGWGLRRRCSSPRRGNRHRPVDPVIWGDEERMKRELMVWAKAVASMEAAGKNTPFSSPSPSMRRK
ncbi:hypothetical protein PVAP13_4KG221406, partial [Panicum virgatum]